MWFIFISARRFYPALLPLLPCDRTGIRLFRREPLNSTGGTCTHEQHTLHRLLRDER